MNKAAMSVKEMAEQMGISLPTAYKLVKQPGFPTIRLGTKILIPVEGFMAWLREQAGGGDGDAE